MFIKVDEYVYGLRFTQNIYTTYLKVYTQGVCIIPFIRYTLNSFIVEFLIRDFFIITNKKLYGWGEKLRYKLYNPFIHINERACGANTALVVI